MAFTPSPLCQFMAGAAPKPGEIQQYAVRSLNPDAYPLRAACPQCGAKTGRIDVRNGQNSVFCTNCDAFQYNAPKSETGERRSRRAG
jgi:hypothetical protein